MKHIKKISCLLSFILFISCFIATTAFAVEVKPGISINLNGGTPGQMADSLKLLFLITIIAMAPSILIMMTGFTRMIIVFSFARSAIGLQQTPPNQVLVGLALFLTLYLMSPVVSEIKTSAYIPYKDGQITQEVAIKNAIKPLRNFMLKQTKNEDLNLFLSMSGVKEAPKNTDEIATETIIPAFITSELKRAFIFGFLIYIPFLIIDMVVASVLMSMGMVMLPPSMISLPFKVMLFVLVDGWGLLVKSLVMSFHL
ncbi:MAG: flagellar type III secretion system pore protein FliP [Clostridiales bacterium]|nr:flagellar type III secretion system pore protein FliP [Clostridiales bacterium]